MEQVENRPHAGTPSAALPARLTWARMALLSLAWLALLAWLRPLTLPDEGRYVGVAWEMMRSGDWLLPTLNGLPYFHKPPLFYWITASSLSVFGPGEWAARAAPLLGAWVGAMAVFLLLRRWWSQRAAWIATAVLLLQPLYYLAGQFANLDMLVAGCITATIALLAHSALCFERGQAWRAALMGAYAAAALGMLAKGLIGFVLPALVITAWLLARRRFATLWALLSLPGVAVFLLIAAPWFVAMQMRFADFLDYFFVVQHFKRFADSGFNNVQPFWFYPALLILATLPWLAWLRPSFTRSRFADPERGPLRLLMVFWLVTIVGFFSLPASKLVGYVLPAVPPLAVLIADGLEERSQRATASRRWWRLSAALSVLLCLVVIGVLTHRTPHSTRSIGLQLRAMHVPGEPVFMLDDYYFDLPLYARLQQPVQVVLDWQAKEVRERDSWRKELADAGDFDSQRAKALLLQPAQWSQALCAQRVSWVMGHHAAPDEFAPLAAAQVSAHNEEATLWRFDRDQAVLKGALSCPETPTAGSKPRS